jgi:hypothetical protein
MLKIESNYGVIIKPDQPFMKKVESAVLRDLHVADEMEWLVIHQRAIEIELRNREVFPEVFIDVAFQENMLTRSATLVGGTR